MPEIDFVHPKYHIADNLLSIQHMRRKGVTAMPKPHSHTVVELYYLAQGERVYFVDDQIVTVHKGELMMIPPHVLHATASSDKAEFERILIHYAPAVLPSRLNTELRLLSKQRFRVYRLSLREQTEIERLLKSMLEECSHRREDYECYVSALFTELFILLQRSKSSSTTSLAAIKHPLHSKVTEITTYLRQNYRDSITLDDTAKRFYVSSSYLSRIFHRLTGFHFREYIIQLRIMESQKQLTESRSKIQEIASAVGFEHLSHFNKTFKKATGMTPMQYRNEAKRQKSEARKD